MQDDRTKATKPPTTPAEIEATIAGFFGAGIARQVMDDAAKLEATAVVEKVIRDQQQERARC